MKTRKSNRKLEIQICIRPLQNSFEEIQKKHAIGAKIVSLRRRFFEVLVNEWGAPLEQYQDHFLDVLKELRFSHIKSRFFSLPYHSDCVSPSWIEW